MNAAGISDRGRVREKNEDHYIVCYDGPLHLFAVADGMGGHAAGEVASSLALEAIRSRLLDYKDELLGNSQCDMPKFMHEMLAFANAKVLEKAQTDRQHTGMGTTLTMVLGCLGSYWLGHIGDSRAYLINDNGILPLTEDHTLVSQLLRNGQISEEESSEHPQRHILTRALGTEDTDKFDIAPLECSPGDIVFICTDGLYTMLADEEIMLAVRSDAQPDELLRQLVELANERGGTDNITAVYVRL